MDMSNANHCNGASTPSDCPYNFYRVSGDIGSSWGSVLTNLAYTLPFLGEVDAKTSAPLTRQLCGRVDNLIQYS